MCIVTYNHERFIEQCVSSALSQTVAFPYEIVVGEDRSTDGTLAILKRLQATASDILKVRERAHNLGAERNFNKTISECSGEYIAFLEGDNYWSSLTKLQRQVEFLDSHPEASFCFHRTRFVDEHGMKLDVVLPPDNPSPLSEIGYLIQESNPVALGSILARRGCLDGLAAWVRGLKLGDWPLCLMLGSRGRIGFIDEEMSIQRQHPGGSWSSVMAQTRVAYVVQMIDRVLPLLDETTRAELVKHRQTLARWWGATVLAATNDIQQKATQDVLKLGDVELSHRLLDGVIAETRAVLAAANADKEFIVEEKGALAAEQAQILDRSRDLEVQLARARTRPLKVARDYLRFRLLSHLAKQTSILPKQVTQRFEKSARKLDPNHSTSARQPPGSMGQQK